MLRKLTIICLFWVCTIQAQNIFHNREFWKTNPNIAQVEEKIVEGNDATQLNRWGFDAVTYALLENVNDETLIHLLSKKGNDVNKLTHDGRTYIFWAAYKNNVAIVKYLLNKGAKTDVIDDKGYSVMNFMAVAGVDNTKLYDLFISKGGNILDKTPKGANALLLFLPNAKDFKTAQYFIDKGMSLEQKDNKGNGLIEYTAQKGNKTMLEALIKKGLTYNKATKNGDNAMLFAVKPARKGYNSLDFFKYLESLGIKANITNKQGQTPLHYLAYSNKDKATFTYFITKEVNANQSNDEGNTPLLNATSRNNIEIIELLASHTKNINLTNKKGYSALTYALRNKPKVVNFLLEKGAAVSVIDTKGNNLGYHLFKTYSPKSEADFLKKLEALERKGLKINKTNKDGNNLYHLAVEKKSVPMLALLKKYTIDINAKNKQGLTPLQQAVMTGKDLKLIKALIAEGANTKVKTDFDETLLDLAKENEALKTADIQFLK